VEGKVYPCSWRKNGPAFEAWLTARPALKARGSTFEEADEALWDLILRKLGDGENQRDYNPPPPSDSDLLEPRLVELSPNAGAEGATDAAKLFDGGWCKRCGQPMGARNGVTISVDALEPGTDAVTCSGACLLFSGDFLELLTRDEHALAEWRPVTRRGRSRKKFFELVPKEKYRFVGSRKLDFLPARCDQCRQETGFFFWDPGVKITRFMSREEIREQGAFVIGDLHTGHLVMTAARWAELRGRAGTRGIVASPVGVVAETDALRAPEVSLPEWWKRMEKKRLDWVEKR
jgi:hypothetical protein